MVVTIADQQLVHDGRLDFGTWQQIFYAEQSGPHDYHYAGLTHLTLPHYVRQAGLEVTGVERGWQCGWLRVDARRATH